jgi:hypothetical protein
LEGGKEEGRLGYGRVMGLSKIKVHCMHGWKDHNEIHYFGQYKESYASYSFGSCRRYVCDFIVSYLYLECPAEVQVDGRNSLLQHHKKEVTKFFLQ